MLVTINTDASYNNQYKIGAYAFWIVCNQGVIKKHGPLKESNGSTDAEFKCICNALHTLLTSGFTDVNRIIINTDAKTIFNSLDRTHLIKSGSVAAKCVSLLDKLKVKYNIPQKHTIHEFRHVQAHTDSSKARNLVNCWCDERAKEEMRKQVWKVKKEIRSNTYEQRT